MVMMKIIIIIIPDWLIYKKIEGDKKFKEKNRRRSGGKYTQKKFNRWKTTRWNKGRQSIEKKYEQPIN